MRNKKLTAFSDLGLGAGLTIINPLTLVYWLSMAPKWIQFAGIPSRDPAIWLGLAAGSCGLATWFTFITFMVALHPQNVGSRFLRVVNSVCGLALAVGGLVLAWQVVSG
jgi:threonine/homoserine/homoserine lactone efflux protein